MNITCTWVISEAEELGRKIAVGWELQLLMGVEFLFIQFPLQLSVSFKKVWKFLDELFPNQT